MQDGHVALVPQGAAPSPAPAPAPVPAEAPASVPAPSPAPPPPPSAQAGICSGKTIYLQIFGPARHEQARALGESWHVRLGADVPPIEDVWDTARRAGRTPPRGTSVTRVVVHDDASMACAEALEPPGDRSWIVKPLSRLYAARRGVIEVWLPSDGPSPAGGP
jgi:hypothetical protein